jgi:hypothetical protein
VFLKTLFIFKILFIALMYEFPEDYFLRSDDLAKKYFENIENSLINNDPGKIRMELKFLFSPHQTNQFSLSLYF